MIDASSLLGELDVGSAPSPCPKLDLADAIGTSSVTNVGDMSATFDKSFSGAGTAPKSFGVYETKQVVREITPRAPVESSSLLDSMDDDKLANLKSKVGADIFNDEQLSAASDSVTITILGDSQKGFSGMSSSSPFASNAITGVGKGALSKYGSPMIGQVQNYTNDSSIRSLIPGSMSKGDYGSLQSMFGSGSLGQFNSCPNLASALNYAKRLLDPNQLLGALSGLFGIIGKLDLKGILKCVSSAQQQVSMVERTGLNNMLVNKGSLNGLNDITSLGNNGTFTNKYDTIRRLSNNRSVIKSPTTYRPTNTWTNPDTINSSNELFDNLGVSPSRVFASDTISPSSNDSITKKLSSPVYSVSAIKDTNPATGFSKFILGGNDSLLRSIPSFLS